MNRYIELESYIQQYCFDRMNVKWEYIDNHYSMLFPAFVEKLDMLMKRWCDEHKDKKQDKVKYLIFQRLRTSGYTGTVEENSPLYEMLKEKKKSPWYRNHRKLAIKRSEIYIE